MVDIQERDMRVVVVRECPGFNPLLIQPDKGICVSISTSRRGTLRLVLFRPDFRLLL